MNTPKKTNCNVLIETYVPMVPGGGIKYSLLCLAKIIIYLLHPIANMLRYLWTVISDDRHFASWCVPHLKSSLLSLQRICFWDSSINFDNFNVTTFVVDLTLQNIYARIAQLVPYQLGTGEVLGSNPGKGDNFSLKISNWFVQIWIRI